MPIKIQSHQIRLWPSFIVAKFFMGIIKVYQVFISPLLGQNCRFYPSCSCYAHQSFAKHGAFKGMVLTVKRLLKCHPFHEGGIDHVPEPTKKD